MISDDVLVAILTLAAAIVGAVGVTVYIRIQKSKKSSKNVSKIKQSGIGVVSNTANVDQSSRDVNRG